MVPFQYLENGMRLHNGKAYPVVKMDWVDGKELGTFIEDSLDRPAVLGVLADRWLELAQQLWDASIAHGDLQHGNVLVVGQGNSLRLVLVDYDGLWVPELQNGPYPSECGLPNYQHPTRHEPRIYNRAVDHFSLLVIYTALSALRVGGRALWQKYGTRDNLLFEQRDFVTPVCSCGSSTRNCGNFRTGPSAWRPGSFSSPPWARTSTASHLWATGCARGIAPKS